MRTRHRFTRLLFAASLCARPSLAVAADLVVAISPDIPPYVLDAGAKGIEADLLRAALPDRSLRFVQMPYDDLETAVPAKADVTLAVQLDEPGVFYSREFVSFVNDAITKKSARLKIDGVADLKDHRVLAWQDAYLELGDAFKSLYSPQSPQRQNYVEVADQNEQVRRFWRDDADVIVIDRSIFIWFSVETGHSLDEVVFHPIFPPVTRFRAGFKDASLRDEFDRGLARLCENDEYAKVLRRYHVELPATVCGRK